MSFVRYISLIDRHSIETLHGVIGNALRHLSLSINPSTTTTFPASYPEDGKTLDGEEPKEPGDVAWRARDLQQKAAARMATLADIRQATTQLRLACALLDDMADEIKGQPR